jgi:DNA primase
MVGEGIGTCRRRHAGDPWTTGMGGTLDSGLRTLDLPDAVRNVIVLADGDKPGESVARDCFWRWKREGRRVRIAHPPQGMDFNDLLLGCARSASRRARYE